MFLYILLQQLKKHYQKIDHLTHNIIRISYEKDTAKDRKAKKYLAILVVF